MYLMGTTVRKPQPTAPQSSSVSSASRVHPVFRLREVKREKGVLCCVEVFMFSLSVIYLIS
jgi:hypothetical protein